MYFSSTYSVALTDVTRTRCAQRSWDRKLPPFPNSRWLPVYMSDQNQADLLQQQLYKLSGDCRKSFIQYLPCLTRTNLKSAQSGFGSKLF